MHLQVDREPQIQFMTEFDFHHLCINKINKIKSKSLNRKYILFQSERAPPSDQKYKLSMDTDTQIHSHQHRTLNCIQDPNKHLFGKRFFKIIKSSKYREK